MAAGHGFHGLLHKRGQNGLHTVLVARHGADGLVVLLGNVHGQKVGKTRETADFRHSAEAHLEAGANLRMREACKLLEPLLDGLEVNLVQASRQNGRGLCHDDGQRPECTPVMQGSAHEIPRLSGQRAENLGVIFSEHDLLRFIGNLTGVRAASNATNTVKVSRASAAACSN